MLRFHHVLIRDAAYRRLLKGTRAELHARLADWIEAQVGDAPEHDETIGWHLEQAHQHLRELGPLDAKGRALGERAARRLAAAGRRALARDDLPLAASLLGRASIASTPTIRRAPSWRSTGARRCSRAGDVGPAATAIDELGRFMRRRPRLDDADDASAQRLAAWHTCFAGQLTVLTAPQALQDAADAVAAAAARAGGARRRRRRGEGALRPRAGARAARQGRRLRGGARPRARRRAPRRRSPPRQRRARRSRRSPRSGDRAR